MNRLRLALAPHEITGVSGPDAFLAKLDAAARKARAGGADLLVLPEYACMEVAAGYPGAGNAEAELASVTSVAAELLAGCRAAATTHDLWLLPGTLPWLRDGAVRNLAPLIAPDGRVARQEKSIMTRFEAERWGVRPGAAPRVFATPFGLIGIAICYDVEFPPLVRAQAEAGAWLILTPSCTDSWHGFNRVRLSAQARALENQCFVAVVPTIGSAPGLASVDENHGLAAVYGPVDRGFAEDGVVVAGAPDTPGLVFADLDQARLETVRADGAVRNFRDWPPPPPPPLPVTPE